MRLYSRKDVSHQCSLRLLLNHCQGPSDPTDPIPVVAGAKDKQVRQQLDEEVDLPMTAVG